MDSSKSNRRRISLENQKKRDLLSKITENDYLSEKAEFEYQLNRVQLQYYNYKLKHNGITSFKQFEGYSRKISQNSLNNLKNYNPFTDSFNSDVNSIVYSIDNKSVSYLNSYLSFQKEQEKTRSLADKQVRQIKYACQKLSYYSKTRQFVSKKSGSYSFRTAFLTLTAPESAKISQILSAFDQFLDYLRRTALCTYVYKKEIGSKGHKLHFHLMINNFIPYYIVSWKWKRLLMKEGVIWPTDKDGKHYDSHYRVELPRNAKQVSGYIAKYMSKGEEMPTEYYDIDSNEACKVGYLWGQSKILRDLKEISIIEGDVDNAEFINLFSKYKLIVKDYVKHLCCDLMKVKSLAPEIFTIFEKQFYDFQAAISQPQKFQYV